MSKFSVVYDAYVLYPFTLRDLLIRLALTDLFKARWTDKIHEEWINAVLKEGKYERSKLERTRDLMDKHVLDAKIYGYEPLIGNLTLPDKDDRHVLAAAIKANADAIISSNVKDFPSQILSQYDIELIHPDDFIYYQFELNTALCCQAVKRQRLALKNPPKNSKEFVDMFKKQPLPKTVSILEQYIDFI